ncbi:GlxA family transcriptional regulator [Alkalimarinus coralli]|uniref:GlxA family transcriptional regulator n=1 Tax=Alkalimarinus coralli TaxID=2935863 RepID=UPI00202B4808|nr:helix-turn-helix domain-containing protein [Alkalimarinus coralli]
MGINIAIVVTERCHASSIFSVVDMLLASNYCSGKILKERFDIFDVTLVGYEEQCRASSGYTVGPLVNPEAVKRPDLVIVPGVVESIFSSDRMGEQLTRYQRWFELIKHWHQQGAVICGACTGNIFLAGSGVAMGRSLTCHWISEQVLSTTFPQERFNAREMLFDHGDIISLGGAYAIQHIVIYLIERFVSRELAMATSKLMMVEPEKGMQSPFRLFLPDKKHGDSAIKDIQDWLEVHFRHAVSIADLAARMNVSERQFCRRFKNATGDSPGNYIQRLRLEFVKHALESNDKTPSAIIWETGYEDVSSFRRLFKRETGMTMNEYRKRFGT